MSPASRPFAIISTWYRLPKKILAAGILLHRRRTALNHVPAVTALSRPERTRRQFGEFLPESLCAQLAISRTSIPTPSQQSGGSGRPVERDQRDPRGT